MRFEATTRRPASSSILVTAPVRLRRVASGLMIEKVRVTAIGLSFAGEWGFARAPSGGRRGAQGSSLLQPLAAVELVELAGHVLALVEQPPDLARGGAAAFVEKQQRAVERLGFRAPLAVGKRNEGRAVGRGTIGSQQHRL